MKGNQQSEEIDYMPKLLMPPDRVGLKICEKIKAIRELEKKTSKSMEFGMWRRETETLLIHAFGPKAKQVHDFKEIRYSPMIYEVIAKPRLREVVSCGKRVEREWWCIAAV